MNQSKISGRLYCQLRDYRMMNKNTTAAQIHLDEETEEQSNQEADEWFRGMEERLWLLRTKQPSNEATEIPRATTMARSRSLVNCIYHDPF